MGVYLATAVARLSISPRVGGYKLRQQVPGPLEKVGRDGRGFPASWSMGRPQAQRRSDSVPSRLPPASGTTNAGFR